jgi:hypothetical protein
MRLILVPLFALPCLAVAQVTGEWKPAKEDVIQFARTADDRVRSMRNVSVALTYQLTQVNAGRGGALYEGAFGPKGEFRVAYPIRTGPKAQGLSKVEIISDAKLFALTGATYQKIVTKPLSEKKWVDKSLGETWFVDYPRLLWASLGTKEFPIAEAVRALKAKGYGVQLQVREVTFPDRVRRQYQIHVASSPQQEKAGLKQQWDMIIDADRKLPVRVTSRSVVPGKPEERTNYELKWFLQAGQKFPADTFKLKK